MLKKTVIISSIFLALSITAVVALTNNHTILKYNIDNQNFSIVVVDDGMGYQKAKILAMKKCAETCRERGFEYFKITSEDKVKVLLGKKDWPNANEFPKNLYQEDIIEKGFNRERFYNEAESRSDTESRDAYRFDFQCVKEALEAYKVCDYTRC